MTDLISKRNILLLAILCLSLSVWPWESWPLPMDSADLNHDSIFYDLGLSAVASSGQFAPFWLQSNRYGEVSAMPFSGNISAGICKPATRPNRWYDYDFAVAMTGRIDTEHLTGWFNQLYAHIRLYIFDITAGIQPQQYGNHNYDLSSGGLLFSSNAHPIPRVTIGIDRYTSFPFTYGFLEIKGGLTHAWVVDNIYVKNYYLHHKFAAARLGGRLPINISYEFHHAAQWGGVSPTIGNLGNSIKDFANVFMARSGGYNKSDIINAEGNHIGMQCLALDIKTKPINISTYWQQIFEDGPVKFIGDNNLNLRDGLWGISINLNKWNFIQSICYEFLNTTDQSGPLHDRDGYVYGGNDSYYINSIYQNGWNYFLRSIGTPFITSPIYNDEQIFTTNNRVRVHHAAIKGDIYGYKYRLMGSHAQNYGRYNYDPGDVVKNYNTALLLEVEKHVEKAWGLDFSLSLSADIGSQFGNSFGAMLSIKKHGLIYKY